MKTLVNRLCVVLLSAVVLGMLGTATVHAQQVSASATVDLKERSKNVAWSGKAILEVTIAHMTVTAGDPFKAGTGAAAGEGKWTIPVNSEAEAQFKGLLEKAFKYTPSFNGEFQSKGTGGGGLKPLWHVGTEPDITVSNEHTYLKYEFIKDGAAVVGTYTEAPIVNEHTVNLPLTDTNKVAPDYYDATGGYVSHLPIAVSGNYPHSAPTTSSCSCDMYAQCNQAVVATIPLVLTCELTETEIQYPISWAQSGDENVNPNAKDTAATINGLVELHEKYHQMDNKNLMQNTGIYGGKITISACAWTMAASEKLITDNYMDIITMVFDEIIDEAKEKVKEKNEKDAEDRDVSFLNSIGVDGEKWRKDRSWIVILGGQYENWMGIFLKKP